MSDYTDITTAHGTIRIIHEMTLGDAAIFTVLAIILIISILQWIINKIWE